MTKQPQHAPTHIVLVDDDLVLQEMIKRFFASNNFKVSAFSDAESAYEAYLKGDDTWDILLTDLNLPQMSGTTLTEKITKLNPTLPIISISSSKSSETAVEVICKGASDFLVKPIHFPQLLVSVERALRLKSYHVKRSVSPLPIGDKTKWISPSHIIGQSDNFVSLLKVARRVAKSDANIFISGECGSGKEVITQFIHQESLRSKGPLIAINCSAIPENLLESELFGHAKGAFTGASEHKMGLFEEAQNGTLFLDEIGDLSPPLQAKLLRVLQEKKIKRVGENKFRPINTRIVSATHKNLNEEVKEGRFREDLFYRLCVIPLSVPPLRDRKDDILLLAESFLEKSAKKNASPARRFSDDATRYLLENPWKGNVRELENVVERAAILASEEEICAHDFELPTIEPAPLEKSRSAQQGTNQFSISFEQELPSLSDLVKHYIEFAVKFNNGAKDRTAKEIGIDRKTLYRRLSTEPEKSDSQFQRNIA